MQESPRGAAIDRYVVLEYLAEGGMGAIYLGKKMGAGGFEKQVVLKQLLPEFTQQPEFIDLFLREARLSATLDHANIIHTIDLVTAGDEHFIVMEYLDGADLRSLIKKAKQKRRLLSAAAGIYIAKELLSALSYAHNKHGTDGNHLHLIHRDISPSNILISANGEVKLTDFGIAKAATHNSIFYRVKGKVGYMSPEQARSDDMDARSDLYSLAVCLFEMMTGERLLVSAGITTSADELYSRPVPLVSKKVPGLPAELDKVMLRALSVDPNHRYQTAAELQEALLRCAHRHGLMMSAPELATHLHQVCGQPSNWRDDEEDASFGDGTEIYDQEEEEGTQQLEESGDDPIDSIFVSDRSQRRDRAKTSMSLLGNLKGVELTSMAALGSDGDGAQPLVDLDQYGQQGLLSAPPPSQSGIDPVQEPYTGVVLVQGTGIVPPSAQTGQSNPAPSPAPPVKAGRPWLTFSFILVIGIGTAAAIGLTGAQLDTSPPTGSEMQPLRSPQP